MATQIQNLPSHWDDKCKHFYRKLIGIDSQSLIDKLKDCIDMHYGRKPINPPYTAGDIVRMAKVLTHILTVERDLDLDLAKNDYEWLEKEIDIIISQP